MEEMVKQWDREFKNQWWMDQIWERREIQIVKLRLRQKTIQKNKTTMTSTVPQKIFFNQVKKFLKMISQFLKLLEEDLSEKFISWDIRKLSSHMLWKFWKKINWSKRIYWSKLKVSTKMKFLSKIIYIFYSRKRYSWKS